MNRLPRADSEPRIDALERRIVELERRATPPIWHVQGVAPVEHVEITATLTEPSPVVGNRARCRKCGTVIESKARHDMVACECKAIALDGGTECPRMLGEPEDFDFENWEAS